MQLQHAKANPAHSPVHKTRAAVRQQFAHCLDKAPVASSSAQDSTKVAKVKRPANTGHRRTQSAGARAGGSGVGASASSAVHATGITNRGGSDDDFDDVVHDNVFDDDDDDDGYYVDQDDAYIMETLPRGNPAAFRMAMRQMVQGNAYTPDIPNILVHQAVNVMQPNGDRRHCPTRTKLQLEPGIFQEANAHVAKRGDWHMAMLHHKERKSSHGYMLADVVWPELDKLGAQHVWISQVELSASLPLTAVLTLTYSAPPKPKHNVVAVMKDGSEFVACLRKIEKPKQLAGTAVVAAAQAASDLARAGDMLAQSEIARAAEDTIPGVEDHSEHQQTEDTLSVQPQHSDGNHLADQHKQAQDNTLLLHHSSSDVSALLTVHNQLVAEDVVPPISEVGQGLIVDRNGSLLAGSVDSSRHTIEQTPSASGASAEASTAAKPSLRNSLLTLPKPKGTATARSGRQAVPSISGGAQIAAALATLAALSAADAKAAAAAKAVADAQAAAVAEVTAEAEAEAPALHLDAGIEALADAEAPADAATPADAEAKAVADVEAPADVAAGVNGTSVTDGLSQQQVPPLSEQGDQQATLQGAQPAGQLVVADQHNRPKQLTEGDGAVAGAAVPTGPEIEDALNGEHLPDLQLACEQIWTTTYFDLMMQITYDLVDADLVTAELGQEFEDMIAAMAAGEISQEVVKHRLAVRCRAIKFAMHRHRPEKAAYHMQQLVEGNRPM